jgi:hypothetical protein
MRYSHLEDRMRGSVVKRGNTWSYVVDVGRDPVTGRRRQRWKGGFPTKREAERALGRALAAVGAGEVADAGGLTVGAYFDQWLAGHLPRQRRHGLEAELLVERAVPRHVAKGDQRDRRQPPSGGPGDNLVDERTPDATTAECRRHRQFVEVAFAVDHPRHGKPNDGAEVVDRHPGALLGRRLRQAPGPVGRIVRGARDVRIVDLAEPLAGRDVDRLHRHDIIGRRFAHHDR